ncbi:hypothetical protein [Nocardioides sp. YIM 152588]|uniref:hypothetical protein n=1 Tax=Nocardioides sp. YIM 152588 TaxID=3158259 RepID=UPI0032E4A94C
MKKLSLKSSALPVVAGAAVLTLLGGVGGAVAANEINSRSIEDNSIRSVDIKDGTIRKADLTERARTQFSAQAGRPVTEVLQGAYYSVANYNAGNTNAGAIATVACKDVTDVAISGGVQVLGLGEGANSRNTPVSSSFPGRMDWSTNTPREDRLDGWIVQFGGNAGATSDVSPENVKIWTLCVPGADVVAEETYRLVD